jgi:hypothetical protein
MFEILPGGAITFAMALFDICGTIAIQRLRDAIHKWANAVMIRLF